MPRLVVCDAARQDVEDTSPTLPRTTQPPRCEFYDSIHAQVELLAAHPGAGPSCEFPKPDLADLHFSPVKKYRSYLVIYRPLPDGAEVVRVIHAATDMRRPFRGA